MKISELGEFGLIGRIAGILGPAPADVVVGIGDDVAVLHVGGSEHLLATCDIQVEGVHFRQDATTPRQLGRKVAAINVSDIAAMGGTPRWALVSLALPDDTAVAFVDELYKGLEEQLRWAGAAVVGGNCSRASGEMMIDLCLLGSVQPDCMILRKGARVGDSVLVTGTLGDSRAGLELILAPLGEVSEAARRAVTERHLTPRPRLKEGQILGASGMVHAMADVSDGLMSDLGHICRAGNVGAEIWMERVPVSEACLEIAKGSGVDPLTWALAGGEDYELLFTVDSRHVASVADAVWRQTGITCTEVGRILSPEEGIRAVHPDGRCLDFTARAGGWDHFARGGNEKRGMKT
ncbi:MAG: thiamine-phosphate kinase [Deltaproteobacteria bacterium]|nr:thiamine-phosphate kinase [Deltaproteobacteria bacterium]